MRVLKVAALGALIACALPISAAAKDKDTGNDTSKFFMFYGDGLPPETIRADLAYCMELAGRTGPAPQGTRYSTAMGGGLLAGIADAIAESVEQRRRRDSSMRTCMGLHGYSRYAMAEADWNAMVKGDQPFERIVQFMTGPVPTTKRLPQ